MTGPPAARHLAAAALGTTFALPADVEALCGTVGQRPLDHRPGRWFAESPAVFLITFGVAAAVDHSMDSVAGYWLHRARIPRLTDGVLAYGTLGPGCTDDHDVTGSSLWSWIHLLLN